MDLGVFCVSPASQGLPSFFTKKHRILLGLCLFILLPDSSLGFRAAEGRKSRQGVEVGGRCRPHKQRHCTHHHRRHDERGPHMPSTAQEEATSVTDTDITAKVGKWETIGLPCAKDSGWRGGVCIFKDSCQRQETWEGGSLGEPRGPGSERSSQCVEWC